jgi:hypothetical protein
LTSGSFGPNFHFMELSPRRILAARTLAIVADAVQIGLLPLFVGGALSTVNDIMDVVVALAMIALVGWHWAFLPAFLSEVVPVFDLVPTWTAAVFFATRGQGAVPGSGSAVEVKVPDAVIASPDDRK